MRWLVWLSVGGILVAATASLTDVKSAFEAGLQHHGIAAGAVEVLQHRTVTLADYQGLTRQTGGGHPVDPETAFHWASNTKTMTGIAIMQLRDRGLLKLDDPAVKYVPELREAHNRFGPIEQVTIRHLMTHSGGFRSGTWPYGGDKDWHPFEPTKWSQIVAMMPYTEVEFPPGSRFHYSNLGVVFLGQIIERLSGDDFEVYIDKNILKPLEMHHTYFDRAPYFLLGQRAASYHRVQGKLVELPFDFDSGITVSNGGLNSPFADMTKYLQFLLGGPNPVYDFVLKRSSLEEMWQPQLKIDLPVNPNSNGPDNQDVMGLSFFLRTVEGRRYIGHYGDQNGFISFLYVQPETGSACLANFNTDAGDGPQQNTRRFAHELRDLLLHALL